MGREIRRVPRGWEHPKKVQERGMSGRMVEDYVPLHDRDYESAIAEWVDGRAQWLAGTHPERTEESKGSRWEDWYGSAPQPDEYRPAWRDEERTCFQVYETVSEGTPVSPVFETEEALLAWLVAQGYSENAARRFLEVGSVPSMMAVGSPQGVRVLENIHMLDENDR